MNLIKSSLGVLGLLSVAGMAQAGVTATVTGTNDYDFRGFSQNAKDPAIQGSVDYAHESGFYVGAWASPVDFPPAGSLEQADLEIDVYAGITKTLEASGVTWDAGLVTYNYPDESGLNYQEVYGSVAKDWFKGKIWYSPDFGGDTFDGSNEAWYLEGNGTFPLPQNFSFQVHLGFSTGDYWDLFGDDVIDYSVGLGYTWQKLNFGLKYVDSETDIDVTSDAFNNEGRVILSVATTFPWAD